MEEGGFAYKMADLAKPSSKGNGVILGGKSPSVRWTDVLYFLR